ncbi:MAG TPA: choice-of-anchor B family protein [Anaerolineae bacterium]|nr:choice-of-anchor B family protein [Anaerolineae bacterium]
MKPYLKLSLSLCLLCFIILGLATYTSAPTATATLPQSDNQLSDLTPLMQRQLKDALPPEDLAPLGATPCQDGSAAGYPCEAIDLLAFMPLASFTGAETNDIWGWTDPETNIEYAILGLQDSTAFVSLANPTSPQLIGIMPRTPTSGVTTWRDVKVYGNYAYSISESPSNGVQVFDLTRLRDVFIPPDMNMPADFVYNGVTDGHNIVINEDTGFAYAVGANNCSGGLHIIDLQNPAIPTSAGCFADDGYTHDAQCVLYNGPDTEHQGKELCFNSNEDTLTIADVTDKNNTQQLARVGYDGAAYAHQGWLTPDHQYFLLGDELDETSNGHNTYTYIWDVRNIDTPELIGIYQAETDAIDHNLYIHGQHAYQANYRAGLRILDVSDIANANLSEVAYFDVYPSNDAPGFNGAWSVYPFFESGIVIVSGIEQGLFVLQPDLSPRFTVEAEDEFLLACGNTSVDTMVQVNALNSFFGDVILDNSNEPTGVTVDFGTNPVSAPGQSLMTITTSGAEAGDYEIAIIGSSNTLTDDDSIALHVDTMNPATTLLTYPTDQTIDVSIAPHFSWSSADQAISYELEVATDENFTDIVLYATDITDTQYTATETLTPGATYYWRITAHNSCGATSSTSAMFTVIEATVVYTNDIEGDTSDWQTAGSGVAWALSSARTSSGNAAWFASDPSNRTDKQLISPPIELPSNVELLTLQFQNYQAFETPNSDGRCWDAGILEVSTDNGTTWQYIDNTHMLADPYDAVIWNDTSGNNPIASSYGAVMAWCDPLQNFTNAIVDITAYAGQTVHFRWRLGSDGAAGGEGWYVDDIYIEAYQRSSFNVYLPSILNP